MTTASSTSSTAEKEVLELESKYWQAIRDADFGTVARLSDDPCVVSGARGVGLLSRAALAQQMGAAKWKLESFEVSDAIVRQITSDVAAVAYKVKEKIVVDGKSLTLEASDSSTWVRRNGSWVCAVHTEAVAGDPFGRDRAT